jgi:eukaryotic-like serine/threonine-protein kinase
MKPLSERLTDRELISRGDLTLAYRARDAVLDRPVFVKILNPALAADPEIRARFEREAKAVARLDHPHLVRIYDYGEDPAEGLFMLLEWLEGRTLTAEMAQEKRCTGEHFIELASQLLRGLAALHSVGILHRDLKPDNILVKSDGTYKITDFSLAALRDAPKLTHHEAIVGTPAYMSPEQAAGGAPDERSDLFSLGVVLWEAVTGNNPFLAGSLIETLKNVRERDLDFNDKSIAGLPEVARVLLNKLLTKDRDLRPASANAALQILGEKAERVAPQSRFKRRNVKYLSIALAILAVYAVIMFLHPWKEQKAAPSQASMITSPSETTSTQQQPVVSEPEFRAPPPEQTTSDLAETENATQKNATPAKKSPAETEKSAAFATRDSSRLFLTTEPWAYVYDGALQLGTTPLAAPLVLPRGEHTLILRNPAFPPIPITLALTDPDVHQSIILSEHVAMLRVNVAPWGELYVDGEHQGTTPLSKPLYVAAGRHTLRISHPQLAAVQREVNAAAGETLAVDVDLVKGLADVKAHWKGTP